MDYTQRFREILCEITDMWFKDQFDHYTAGLKLETACEVEYQSLQDAILIAHAYDKTHYGPGSRAGSGVGGRTVAACDRHYGGEHDVHDLELDFGRNRRLWGE
jgi:hypothetical protein